MHIDEILTVSNIFSPIISLLPLSISLTLQDITFPTQKELCKSVDISTRMQSASFESISTYQFCLNSIVIIFTMINLNNVKKSNIIECNDQKIGERSDIDRVIRKRDTQWYIDSLLMALCTVHNELEMNDAILHKFRNKKWMIEIYQEWMEKMNTSIVTLESSIKSDTDSSLLIDSESEDIMMSSIRKVLKSMKSLIEQTAKKID